MVVQGEMVVGWVMVADEGLGGEMAQEAGLGLEAVPPPTQLAVVTVQGTVVVAMVVIVVEMVAVLVVVLVVVRVKGTAGALGEGRVDVKATGRVVGVAGLLVVAVGKGKVGEKEESLVVRAAVGVLVVAMGKGTEEEQEEERVVVRGRGLGAEMGVGQGMETVVVSVRVMEAVHLGGVVGEEGLALEVEMGRAMVLVAAEAVLLVQETGEVMVVHLVVAMVAGMVVGTAVVSMAETAMVEVRPMVGAGVEGC